jgi:pimeloyl-ACP methyl ester carboxylesterase
MRMHRTRRQFIADGSVLALGASVSFGYQGSPVIPLVDGPEVERYRRAQERALAKFGLHAQSRYIPLLKPALMAHVLVAGHGDPVLLIHGGGTVAVQFAPLLSGIGDGFRCFAPDRPGCGLTDKFDYVGVPFRQHAVDFVTSLLDELHLPKAAIAGNSMGGYWALVFALAAPKRVTKLVLLGGVAGSPPPPGHRLPNAGEPSLESTRAVYHFLMANGDRAASEIVEADYAASVLPEANRGWNSMLEELSREGVERTGLTYALRPELKNLKPPTLFIWGDKDIEGPPSLAQEMAAIVPHARCEIMPDAGHLVWLDQPDRCTKLMLDFLRSA